MTITAKDAYGNTTPSYTGEKKITFTASGTPTETSPGGNVPGVINNAGTPVPFGSPTPITFTNGVATSASSKNGYLRLYKPGTATISVSDGTFTGGLAAVTVTRRRQAGRLQRPHRQRRDDPASCLFTCAITTLGNSGTISGKLAITDEYGNVVSNLTGAKTATLSVTAGSPLGTMSGSPVGFPETGPAISTTSFTYTSPASGTYTNT